MLSQVYFPLLLWVDANALAGLQANSNLMGQGKRRRVDIDADGDVIMGQEVRERAMRGGKKLRRKKQRGLNGTDIEMEDVEVREIALLHAD